MSSVFRAVHTDTGHEVALKVLPRALAKNPTLLQRFLREAKSAESLQHPNVASIYDRGVDQGRHYLALEFVPGGDFHEFVQRSGPLAVHDAISVVKQVARGLDYAAGRGLIHRDIKPSNMLRTPAGQVKIIDLGLAIHSENEDERVTREGTTVGTVDYMAPEQARDSRATTIQSDMYSLGCTFYYLVTGLPPFPGGDITDKLSRHAKAPPPDPRIIRPEIPDSVARIILRLLAKNSKDRFARYEDLIAELDSTSRADRKPVPGISSSPVAAEENLDVDFRSLNSPADREDDSRGGETTFPILIPLISLAELVADHDEPSIRRDRPSAEPLARLVPKILSPEILSEGEIDAELDEESESAGTMPGMGTRANQSSSDANWILGWILTGTAAVVIVIGLDQLIRRSIVAPDVVPAPASRVVPPPFRGIRAVESSKLPANGDPGRPKLRPNATSTQIPGNGMMLQQTWVEPDDDQPKLPPQRFYDAATLDRFLPEWANQPIPETITGTKITVRRISEPPDPNTVSTLRQGLNLVRGDLELAGDGPFLIDDFRIPGVTRLIRARPGFRPIIHVERSDLEAVREQPGVVVLEGKTLILDGIDLVVDARDHPEKRPYSLFHCVGSDLMLRNCSVTLVNPNATNFSLVRTLGSATRASRVRLEATVVRGAAASMFELGGAGDELVLDGSVAFGGSGPIIRSERFDPVVDQKISLIRSILACRGPIIDLRGKFEAGRSRGISVKILGSALGRFLGVGIASVVGSSTDIETMSAAVDWRGEDNSFAGWKGFFASGPEPRILVSDLADLRSTWNASDQSSKESPAAWRPPSDLAFATNYDLPPLFLLREGTTLSRVARPSPNLLEKTIGSFPTPEIPEPSFPTSNGGTTPQGGSTGDPGGPSASNRVGAGGDHPGLLPGQAERAGLELVFLTQDPAFQGDLGVYIAKVITPDLRWARITVRGSGKHPFSPVRLPVGSSLEIRVDPPTTPNAEWPTWSPDPGAADRPLIELMGGQLMLSGLRINLESDSQISNVVRIQDGQLVVMECQFVRRGGEEAGRAPLIDFLAPTTRPVSVSSGLSILSPQSDRPVCRILGTVLITDGTALKGEMGRGLLALSQCAIAAGQAAIELIPTLVSRRRFDCDLWIDHSTIASNQDLIRTGEWRGAGPGPERPWLISSSNSAYLAAFARRAGETVLLKGDEETLAHTDFFWQGTNDALEVEGFMASSAGVPAAGRARDVVLHWVNCWGTNHVRKTTGPRLSNNNPSVQLFHKLQSGRVEPSDLILDPDHHPGRKLLDLGADLGKLGIAPKKGAIRPKR